MSASRDTVSEIARDVRARSPLVQCITNYVSMDIVANVLNAVGASPAMVHDAHESGEFARIASALCINIGTPSPPWVEGMRIAVRAAREAGTPWVLDPVAVGATSYRREIVTALLAERPAVIRGNASEILAMATAKGGGRGVDSAATSGEAAAGAAEVALAHSAVVVVTGADDVVTDGTRTAIVRGGDGRMPLITALGCASTALVAACCAVGADPFSSSIAAMAMLAAAGERAGRRAEGPGSLRVLLLDELASLDAERLGAVRIDLR